MFRDLTVRNFRCFRELRIDHLSNINLFTGRNNSGKTSLLESVFLLARAGDARVALDPFVLRSLEPHDGIQTHWPFWKQFFTDLDLGHPVKIWGEHAEYGRLALEVTSGRQSVSRIPLDRTDRVAETKPVDDRTLEFLYRGASGDEVQSRILVDNMAASVEQGN